MASQAPPHAAKQSRMASSQHPLPSASDSVSAQQSRRSSITQSATSEDSQTVLLDNPVSREGSLEPSARRRRPTSKSRSQSPKAQNEPRKCWICFGDETEDTPTSSEWRSPCPCALKAHESCLLDWVADLEDPSKEGRKEQVQCPQCKSKISISRPHSLSVEVFQAVKRASDKLALPFMLITLFGTVATGCWVHGHSTVYLIFGTEDAELLMGINRREGMKTNWKWGLPFIPMAIMASRTSNGDSFLQLLSVFYFASRAPAQDGNLWPPSAAMTIAALPYFRTLYNEFYARVLEPKEKLWTQQIKPRATDSEDIQEDQGEEQNHGGVVELGLGVEVEVVDEEEIPGENDAQREGLAVNNPPAPADAPAGAAIEADRAVGNNQENGGPHNQEQLNHHNHVRNWGVDLLEASRFIVGALLFPTISSRMGDMLKIVLPKTWTVPPGRFGRYPSGFLQSRFGRSIVGGCLFVVVKDTFTLYAKYRMAQNHKKRRVVDFHQQSQ